MPKVHQYQSNLTWTGNKGSGTMDYRSYDRSFSIAIPDKPELLGSSDSAFLGDKTKHNPEDLLISSISSCHMLWFLHLCAEAGITVLDYRDAATGTMAENTDGSGRFTEVVLHPVVLISDESQVEQANKLHEQANKMCFIANSCNFPIRHQPSCSAEKS